MNNQQFLTLRDVEKKTTLKKTTIYELMKKAEFPRPYALTKRKIAWSLDDVEIWMLMVQSR
jgi:prophage regulatory protein